MTRPVPAPGIREPSARVSTKVVYGTVSPEATLRGYLKGSGCHPCSDKQIKAPYVIYADFECITEPICKAVKKSDSSYTDAYQSHTPCGFCYHVVSSDPSQTFEPEIYRGEDTISEFICRMKDTEQKLMEKIKTNVPMVMTPQA